MKKFLISLTMAFIAICAFAQDMPKFSEFAADTEFYLFNVETKAFLIGANDWGTRASVDVEKGYLTKLTVNGDTYKLEDQTPKGWNELDCNGIGDMWVDGAGRGGAGMWTVTDLGGNKYEIGNTNVAGKLGVNDIAADTRLYMNGANTTWAFVTAEDYAAYIEAAAEEIAKQKQEKLDAANMLAIQARKDLAEKTTVYNQEGYDAYTAKTAELEELIKAGNYTEAVVSPNSTTGWHSSTEYNFLLTPWTIGGEAANNFDKALYINTWSVEGVTDGSNFLVPFFEYWTGDGNSLDANELATTITGLTPNAEYEATAWARVRIKNGGGTEANGITFQAGKGEAANVCDGQAFGQMVVKEVSAKGYADANGELVVKFVVADNNISWLSYKNVAVKATGEIANDSIIYPEVALDSTLTFEPVDGGVVVKVNSVEGLDAVVNDAKFPELNDRKLSDFTYMKVKATIFEIDSENNAVAVDDHGWYQSVADPVTEGDTITYDFKPATSYKIVVNKIALIDGRNGNLVTDKDYNAPYEFATGGFAKPILIAFDRIAGQGYTGDEIPYDEEEILAALKITSWDQITTMYPANMETGEPDQDYDGWRSPSGSPTAWGNNSYACVKYPHDGSMFLCTMPGNEPEAGTAFNCGWILGTEENEVFVNITVNFIEAPKFTLPIADLAINKEVKYELTEGAYVEKKVTLSDDEVSSICEGLGIKSLDEATVYGFNPTDESLLTSYAGFDGWRDAEGNFHNWTGDGNAPACVKYTNGQEYLCYNIGGLTDQTIKTYWAIGNGEKVVLVCIDFVYGTGVPAKDPTGINGIAGQSVKANGKYFENGKVVIYKNGAKYSVSGAALK